MNYLLHITCLVFATTMWTLSGMESDEENAPSFDFTSLSNALREPESRPNSPTSSPTLPKFTFGSSKEQPQRPQETSSLNLDELYEALEIKKTHKPSEEAKHVVVNLRHDPNFYLREIAYLKDFNGLELLKSAREAFDNGSLLVWEWLTPEEQGFVRIMRQQHNLPAPQQPLARVQQIRSSSPKSSPRSSPSMGPRKKIEKKPYEKN